MTAPLVVRFRLANRAASVRPPAPECAGPADGGAKQGRPAVVNDTGRLEVFVEERFQFVVRRHVAAADAESVGENGMDPRGLSSRRGR